MIGQIRCQKSQMSYNLRWIEYHLKYPYYYFKKDFFIRVLYQLHKESLDTGICMVGSTISVLKYRAL